MLTMLTTLTVYALTFLVVYFGIKFISRKSDSRKHPPCLLSLPVVGSLPFIADIKTLHVFFKEKAKHLGNVIAFYLCNRYVVVLNGRETIQEAFVRQSQTFANRPLHLSQFYVEERKGIVSHQYDEQFKKLHRISLNILRTYGFGQGIMESRITLEIENLVKRFELQNGQAFDPNYDITASISNVICSIIFGKRWDIDDPEFKQAMEIAKVHVRDTDKMVMITFYPMLRYLPSFHKALNDQLDSRQQWRRLVHSVVKDNPDMKSDNCFYEALKEEMSKEEKSDMNEEDEEDQLINTIKDLFLAGTETTAATLEWFIICMINHQNVQKSIRNEVDRAVGVHRFPTLDDKPNLPLLEAAILEVLRFKTLVPLAVPHATLRDTYINDIFIPANTMILANLYSCHMDPNVWKEPEKFNIDRFLDETKTKVINKEHVVSFSLGKRACLGEILARQELFLFTSALIHKFEILPPVGMDQIDITERIGLINNPKPFEARFIKRQI